MVVSVAAEQDSLPNLSLEEKGIESRVSHMLRWRPTSRLYSSSVLD